MKFSFTYKHWPNIALGHRLESPIDGDLRTYEAILDGMDVLMNGFGEPNVDYIIIVGFDKLDVYFSSKATAVRFKLLWQSIDPCRGI